jgi:hypothetical protein
MRTDPGSLRIVVRPLAGALTTDFVRSLRERAMRDRHGLFLCEGLRFLARAVDNGTPIAGLVLCREQLQGSMAHTLVDRVRKAGVPVLALKAYRFNELPLGADALVCHWAQDRLGVGTLRMHMDNEAQPSFPPSRTASLFLFLGHLMLAGMLTYFGTVILPAAQTQPAPSHGLLVYGIAFVAAGGTLFFAFTKMRPSLQPGVPLTLSPQQFQTNLLIALSFAETIVLVGCFIGVPAGLSMLPFGAVSILLMLGVILPHILAYWSVYDATNPPK